ncbi:MAG: hypothetical protein HY794_06560 [Desulfarculus sp.]|nr:hypothetical protein [Desulfarculus sp.]
MPNREYSPDAGQAATAPDRLGPWRWLADAWALPLGAGLWAAALPGGLLTFALGDFLLDCLASERLGKYPLVGLLALAGLTLWRAAAWLGAGRGEAAGGLAAGARALGRGWQRLLRERPWLGDALLIAAWLAWASLWWDRGYYPYDDGYEATLAYMWKHGLRPYTDYFLPPIGLLGLLLNRGIIELFGFSPLACRLAFVLVLGGTGWLVFRLLKQVVPVANALLMVVTCVYVLAPMHIFALLWFWWNGAFLVAFTALCTQRMFASQSPGPRLAWTAASALGAVATLFTVLPLGVAMLLCLALLLPLRWLLGDAGRRVLSLGLAWAAWAALFLGLALWFIHGQGWWPGYQHWLASVAGYSHNFGDRGLSQSLLGSWSYLMDKAGASPFPRSLMALASLAAGLVLLRRLSRPAPEGGLVLAARPANLFTALYLAAGLGLLIWLAWSSQACLEFLAGLKLARALPPLALGISLLAAWCLFRQWRAQGRQALEGVFTWLVLLLFGGASWMAGTKVHQSLEMLAAMSLLIYPAVWAAAAHLLPGHLRLAWPVGCGLFLALLLGLGGAGTKALATVHQGTWWQEAPRFSYPALRQFRNHYAPELDQVLFTAREAVQKGERILVFPHMIPIYPLVGALPPVPFPTFEEPRVIFTYPKDPAAWAPALAAIEKNPPDLLVLWKVGTGAKGWATRQDSPFVPQVIKDVNNEYYLGRPQGRYQMLLDGRFWQVYRLRASGPASAPGPGPSARLLEAPGR